MKKIVLVFGLLSSVSAFARPDLLCTTLGVMDAGFEVSAWQTSADTYRLHVQTISGFGNPEVLVDETVTKQIELRGDLATAVFVTKDQRTKLRMLPKRRAQLERLNGEEPTGLFARLKCETANDAASDSSAATR